MATPPAWTNWLAISLLGIATWQSWYWVWGVLFVWWSIWSLQTNHTMLLFSISKQEQPALFAFVNLMWLAFGIWYIVYDLLWRFEIYTVFGIQLYSQ